jgi:hypothetical protein
VVPIKFNILLSNVLNIPIIEPKKKAIKDEAIERYIVHRVPEIIQSKYCGSIKTDQFQLYFITIFKDFKLWALLSAHKVQIMFSMAMLALCKQLLKDPFVELLKLFHLPAELS